MKRYEKFNNNFKENKSAEQQAIEMLIAYIEETYGIEIQGNMYGRYQSQMNWLNEEI